LRRAGYLGEIISFEPLSEAHRILTRNSRSDDQWKVPSPVAVGDAEGKIKIHIAGNSVSSSALGMLDAHRDGAPESAFIGTEHVRVATLDSLLQSMLGSKRQMFLKIDTQGYEGKVLDGARNTLAATCGLQIELSLVPLYEGQALFNALLERLHAAGFKLWAIQPGFYNKATGRMLQVDAVLFRDNAPDDAR
jgi:FkbM family methyltransferase